MTWKRGRVLERFCLFKRKILSNDDKLPESLERPTRFQRQPAAKPNRNIGNRPDSEKEIASKRTTTSPLSDLISDPKTPFREIRSPDACWNVADRENDQSANSVSAKQQVRKSQSPYQPEANSKKPLSPQKVSSSSSALFPLPRFATHLSIIFVWDPFRNMSAELEKSRCTNFKILQFNVHTLLRDPNNKSSEI